MNFVFGGLGLCCAYSGICLVATTSSDMGLSFGAFWLCLGVFLLWLGVYDDERK